MSTPSYSPQNAISPFLPDEFQLPTEEGRFKEFYAERERKTASELNVREIGQFEKQELMSGQTWFSVNSGPKKPRYVFRKVIDFGALPATTTKSVAHGISLTSEGFFTKIIAVSKNPSAIAGEQKYIQIGFASPIDDDNIAIWCDDTDVYIQTGSDRTAWTQTYAVLEYIKF